MPIWRRLLDDQLDIVAAESRGTIRSRLVLAGLIAGLMAMSLGPVSGAGWLAAMLTGQIWTWPTTAAPVAGRPNTPLMRLSYVGAMMAASAIWSGAALLYWLSGQPALRLVAVGILAGQMIHAQSFAFRSKLALAILGGAPAVVLVVLTGLMSGFHGVQLATLCITMLLTVLYVFMSARVNMRTAQALEVARRQAVEANNAKSAFLAMMSHELRTPLNGVLGMAHVLKSGRLDADQARQVALLINSGDGLLAILNDILDISKIEAGRLELEATPFDLIELGERVHDIWRGQAETKGVRLVYDVTAGTPRWLAGDPTRLRQIMLNLVSNALKFTETGEVRLSLRPLPHASAAPDASRFEIAVSDTGIGITEEQRRRLFERFAQAEVSTTRQYGGTGLGLSICKQLTELMGGEISVDSQPGRGSTFRVTLELPPAEPQLIAKEAELTGLTGRRILVVDDNQINQAVARGILEAVGAYIEVANDGAEALEVLRGRAFDVVLMDVHMPRMDGMVALRHIRAGDTGCANLPVIALTADAMNGEGEKLLALGFDDVQPKPIQPIALITAIAAACKSAHPEPVRADSAPGRVLRSPRRAHAP